MYKHHEVKNKPSFYCEFKSHIVPVKVKDNRVIFQRMGTVANTETNKWLLNNKNMSVRGIESSDKKMIAFKSMPDEKLDFEMPDATFSYISKIVATMCSKFNVNIRTVSMQYLPIFDDGDVQKVYMILKVVNPSKETKDKIKKMLDGKKIKNYNVRDDLHFLVEEKELKIK